MSARNNDYIIDKVDRAITELVHEKWKIQKAYNYYNGKRDPEQFRYLEENFGIGTATSVEFTPLIKKHVDALVGEYLDIPILPKVSCKDKHTISKIHRDLEIAISKKTYEFLRTQLNNKLLEFVGGQNPTIDQSVQKSLEKLIEDVKNDFISDYEIAAQDVVEYCIQSRHTDLANKLRIMLLDLLVSGTAFYKVKPSSENTNVQIEVASPLNVFVDRNPNSQYVKDCYRVVVRKWMTKQQILNEYGTELSREGISELEDLFEHYIDYGHTYIRSLEGVPNARPYSGDATGLRAGEVAVPGYPVDDRDSFPFKLLPVFEVEWIDVDKENGVYVQNRYEGVRIGESIYITRGKSENVIRSIDNPTKCGLSVNGIFLTNRNHEPQSLVLQCAPLQDKYDVVMYLRDNILANSGTAGDWLDISMLPTVLGSDLTERIQKWIAYKKSGTAIIDTSQEGRAFNNNTSFAGFDDAVRIQTIQAFDLVLLRIEEQTSSITGVFRERLNGIQQRDAVSNVEAGARNSYIITKPFYQQMDTLTIDILGDCLNIAKIVWKNGLTGTIILGDKMQRIFTALPEHFTHTDYDIHIVPSTQILKDLQQLQGIVVELIKGGMIEPDMAVEAMTARSLTELKDKITKAWAKKKKEADQIGQLQQKLQETMQQLDQMSQQNQQLQTKLESLNEAKLQLEKEKLKTDADIRWFTAQTDREYKTKQAEVDSKKIEVELAQMYDGNPYNDQVRLR